MAAQGLIRWKKVLQDCLEPWVIKRSAAVAAVVGTALNLIHHYDALLGGGLTADVLVRVALTYLIPYLVSTHGQITGCARRQARE
ncbi:MAG: hypothetical protein KatS3mg082_3341 [Nitrospiraceae bacterium]|nr:MAG: hypothetical protein KatS3mg082_3341 [Nitrospiraceae bacterium]